MLPDTLAERGPEEGLASAGPRSLIGGSPWAPADLPASAALPVPPVGEDATGLAAAESPLADAGASAHLLARQPAPWRTRAPSEPAGDVANPAANAADDTWLPASLTGADAHWLSLRPDPPIASLPPLAAAAGVTALAGQALGLSGRPLAGVAVHAAGQATTTDANGQFLLADLPAGHLVLTVDGRPASDGERSYGSFEIGVDLAAGQTTALEQPVWLPALDTAHTVPLDGPTTDEVVLTTPRIPGLEVHLPAGSTVQDRDGNAVTELGITAIPVDRPPFPLPRGVIVPIYFTVQPGGTVVSPYGARIVYPNYHQAAPGTRVDFRHYDPAERGWYVCGRGTVTPDGAQVVPDPGVAVHDLTGAMIDDPDYAPPDDSAPPDDPPPRDPPIPPDPSAPPDAPPIWGGGPFGAGSGGPGEGADPVDLASGLFVLRNADLAVPDVLPVALTRTYRQRDSHSRDFGIGSTHPHQMFLWSAAQFQQVDLVLPSGGRLHYSRTSPGISYLDAEFTQTTRPGAYYLSRIRWNGHGWDLTLQDGTVYVFGVRAPLQAIRDRWGNQVTIVRQGGAATGPIAAIRSPNGRWLELSYDPSNRISQARDNGGLAVDYTYDGGGHLSGLRYHPVS